MGRGVALRERGLVARRAAGAIALACAAALTAACVETVTPIRPGTPAWEQAVAANAARATEERDAGDGNAREESRPGVSSARIAVAPLGRLAYDGRTLPVVAPEGSMIFVQEGLAPAPGVAAGRAPVDGAAGIGPESAVAAYRVRPPGPAAAGGLERISTLRGVLLGRSVAGAQPAGGGDAPGVLVEEPRATGRRIGLWTPRGGVAAPEDVRWLVDAPGSHAMAISPRPGWLVWSRTPAAALVPADGAADAGAGPPPSVPLPEVVIRDERGAERVIRRAGLALLWPAVSPDRRTLAMLAVEPASGEVRALAVPLDDDGPEVSLVLARAGGDLLAATLAGLMTPVPVPLPEPVASWPAAATRAADAGPAPADSSTWAAACASCVLVPAPARGGWVAIDARAAEPITLNGPPGETIVGWAPAGSALDGGLATAGTREPSGAAGAWIFSRERVWLGRSRSLGEATFLPAWRGPAIPRALEPGTDERPGRGGILTRAIVFTPADDRPDADGGFELQGWWLDVQGPG